MTTTLLTQPTASSPTAAVLSKETTPENVFSREDESGAIYDVDHIRNLLGTDLKTVDAFADNVRSVAARIIMSSCLRHNQTVLNAKHAAQRKKGRAPSAVKLFILQCANQRAARRKGITKFKKAVHKGTTI
jgi:V8-like Glu-specific endopeptidase